MELTITFEGPAGSGKTIAALATKKLLEKAFTITGFLDNTLDGTTVIKATYSVALSQADVNESLGMVVAREQRRDTQLTSKVPDLMEALRKSLRVSGQ